MTRDFWRSGWKLFGLDVVLAFVVFAILSMALGTVDDHSEGKA